MKNGKRRHAVIGAGSACNGQKRKLQLPTMRVAMFFEPMTDGVATLCVIFHGAAKAMLAHVFRKLKGSLFSDYSMTVKTSSTTTNGKCRKTLVVHIRDINTHYLSLREWPVIIRHLMERTFRCRVTCFDKYEKFLNA